MDRVMLFDEEADRAATIAANLGAINLAVERCHEPREAVAGLRRVGPSLAVIVGAELAFGGLLEAAKALGIPALALVEPGEDPMALAARVRGFDGWACLTGPAVEVPGRVAALLESRRRAPAPPPPIDQKFLGLIVHDLRTPLNVIGLTIRAIHMSVPQPTADFEEDLAFLTENSRQIERMLTQLGDYCRLIEAGSKGPASEFDPRRFLGDFVEDHKDRAGAASVRLELAESCPREVRLDQVRARMALQHAMANATAAAGDTPVRIKAGGEPGRWIVELIVDKSPPESVHPVDLRPDSFERLIGVAAERRGLDLAIAASVTASFGGTARLEVEPGRRSTVVLDWPDRPDPG